MILVFKTSVSSKKKQKQIKTFLDSTAKISNWKFALYDRDNILRIESDDNISGIIINELNRQGFECRELD